MEKPVRLPDPHGNFNLRPPWTPEEQLAASRKGGLAKKKYTLRGALARKLKARQADGTRPWDNALDAFVNKLLEGDARAIELAMLAVDGPQVQKRSVEHSVSKTLVILPDADPRGRVVEALPAPTSDDNVFTSDTDD